MMMMKHILLLVVGILLSEYSDACHPTDQEALLEFKKGITFDSSGLLKTWVPTTDCCNAWEGIRCNLGRVINLSRLGFSYSAPGPNIMAGTLSPFLGNLSSLIVLDLNGLSDLDGPIPTELSKLTQLGSLSLGGNKLQGPIPGSFAGLTQLEYLTLDNNRLTGPVPQNLFAKMPKLVTLSLASNTFSGEIPSSIVGLNELRFLDLAKNGFSGSIPKSIAKFPTINSIKLDHNNLSGNIPVELGDVKSVFSLLLSDNQLTGEIPEKLLNLENLVMFDVSGNRLSGKIPPHKTDIPASTFERNPDLCGAPLPPCKN